MRRRLLLLLLIALAALTTGCLKVDVAIDVNDDGSGAIHTIQAVDVDAIQRVDGAGAFEPGDMVPDSANLPDQVQATRYRQDGYEGVELSADFRNLDELDSRLQDIADAFAATFGDQGVSGLAEGLPGSDAPPGDSLAGFRIGRTVDGWTFEGDGIGTELGPQASSALADNAELRLEVRLPGRPLSQRHNADKVKGNTFIWELRADDTRDRLFAETGPGSPDTTDGRWLWGGLMIGLAGVATLAVVLLARRHQQRPPGPPRPPKPPKPGTRPEPVVSTPAATVVDATGWPRHPPPHPPLLPQTTWTSGMPQGPAPGWTPAASRPGGAPTSPVESTSNRRDSAPETPPWPPPAAPTDASLPAPVATAPGSEPVPDEPTWQPPPGWPMLGMPPDPPTGDPRPTEPQETDPAATNEPGLPALSILPRRPTDLPQPPSAGGTTLSRR